MMSLLNIFSKSRFKTPDKVEDTNLPRVNTSHEIFLFPKTDIEPQMEVLNDRLLLLLLLVAYTLQHIPNTK